MKQQILLALAAVSLSAFAQAPPGVIARPPAETSPSASGGAPAAKAQMKVDERKGTMPMAGSDTSAMGMGGMAMDWKAMDTNGDGMISKHEWNSYHSMMWNKMKPKMKRGMMPMADMEAMMKGGPN